jgi:hypothetical protein
MHEKIKNNCMQNILLFNYARRTTMITRSNVVDGSKPYIVEDRPMISLSSGDRGELFAMKRERILIVSFLCRRKGRRRYYLEVNNKQEQGGTTQQTLTIEELVAKYYPKCCLSLLFSMSVTYNECHIFFSIFRILSRFIS